MRGKIGVYGRSIGGIAASHLVRKFPHIIKVFVGDRTMSNLSDIVYEYLKPSKLIYNFYRCLTRFDQVDNSLDILSNPNCFKVMTFDDADTIIGTFCSLYQGIAVKLSTHDYSDKIWKDFYDSLVLLYHLEDDEDQDQYNSKESALLWMSGRSRTYSNPKEKEFKDVSVGKSIHFDMGRANNASVDLDKMIDDRSYIIARNNTSQKFYQ